MCHIKKMSICPSSNDRSHTQQMQQQRGLWLCWSAVSGRTDRALQPPRVSHRSGLVMKFRAPRGRLALNPVAVVIEHMVWQPVKPKRPVLISAALMVSSCT